MKPRIKIVFFLMLLLPLMAFEIRADSFEFSIRTEKSDYLLGEPVILDCILKNVSQGNRKVYREMGFGVGALSVEIEEVNTGRASMYYPPGWGELDIANNREIELRNGQQVVLEEMLLYDAKKDAYTFPRLGTL